MSNFPHLFSPVDLGGLTDQKSALFFPPHGTSLVEDGKVGDRLVAYHEARAKGGVGLVIIEGMSMHPSFDNPVEIHLRRRSRRGARVLPAWRAIAAPS